MSNPNIKVFKYRGLCTPEYYNQFFNPNICHVCKSVDKGNLILCDQCYLISYCSEEHKMADDMEHVDICTFIADVLKSQRDSCTYSNSQQGIQSRKKLMELIQQRFYRPMEPYMQQMILWSKSCIVCHQQDDLQVCKRCFSANYCNKHVEAFKKKHDRTICDQLMLLLNIDIETISGNTTDMCYDFLSSVNEKKHIEEMLEFCIEYLLTPRENIDWLAKDYVQSDYLSGPLTIYYGLKKIRSLGILQTGSVIIEIVAANSVDVNSLPAWEVLLHLIPEIKTLSIILIGPELKDGCKKQERCKLCELCSQRGNELFFFSISELYHNAVASLKCGVPNIIVGFHPELSEGDTWSESIKAMKSVDCPLLLSSSSAQKAQNDIIKIQETIGSSKDPFHNCKNDFSGLTPHRDLETGNIYFRNEYIIFYDDLHDYYDTGNYDNSSSSDLSASLSF